MEALPDELVLAVLQRIEPLRDTAAVMATCRRLRSIMSDPHLWPLFHHRVFPTHFAADTPDDSDHHQAGPETTDLPAFAKKARSLKAAMNSEAQARRSRLDGHDGRLLAAASVGCASLVQRYADGVAASLFLSRDRDTLATVATVVDSPSPVNLINEALRRACAAGSAPTAKASGDEDDAAYDPEKNEPLCSAARTGNRQLAALLLDHGAQPNGPCRLSSPLEAHTQQIAAKEGDAGMLELLLRYGARTDSSSAVSNAAGHLEAVRLLVHHGCFHPRDKKSRPLQPAVRSGNVEVVRLLLEHGAKPRVRHVKDALRPVKPSMEMLRLLAPGLIGSRIDAVQSFDLLTSPGASGGGEEVCRLLVDRGVDINAQAKMPPDPRSHTPLHFAVMTADMRLARSLLACGAAADVRPRDNKTTALGLARQLGRHEIAQVIVKHQLATATTRSPKVEESTTNGSKRKSRGETDDDDDNDVKEQNGGSVHPPSDKKAKKKRKRRKKKRQLLDVTPQTHTH